MPKYRCRKNRDPQLGMKNRQWGLSKKANTFKEFYNADVVVVIRRPDGRYGGYQSRPGLIRKLQEVPESFLLSPEDFVSESKKDAISIADNSSPLATRSNSTLSFTSSTLSSASDATFTNDSSESSNINHLNEASHVMNESHDQLPPLSPSTFMEDSDRFLGLDMDFTLENQLFTPNATTPSAESQASCLVHPAPISIEKKNDIFKLLDKYF